MTTETLRKLTVDGVVYGWRVTHRHRPDTQRRVCVNQFMAFRQGTSKAPLRILFPEGPAGGTGYIQQHGVVEVFASSMTLNLHRPKTAAALIRRRSRRPGRLPQHLENRVIFHAPRSFRARPANHVQYPVPAMVSDRRELKPSIP
jgi:hypothetical protein